MRIESMNASHKLLEFINHGADERVKIVWCLRSRDKTNGDDIWQVSVLQLIKIEINSYNRGARSQAATCMLINLEAIVHDAKCNIPQITEELMATWDPINDNLLV